MPATTALLAEARPSVGRTSSAVLQRCGGHPCSPGSCLHDEDSHPGELRRLVASPLFEGWSARQGLPAVRQVLRERGQPLDDETRRFMETRLGHDFSRVRIHADSRAAKSARGVDAAAYTVGRHIAFADGRYAPRTSQGRSLLAHELAHVVQQGPEDRPVGAIGSSADPLERAADAAAVQVTNGEPDGRATSRAGTAGGPDATPAPPTLRRRVAARLVHHCTALTDGAPDDPVAALTDADTEAADQATTIARLLDAEADGARTGMPADPSEAFLAYQNRFGLPPAVGAGFLNRLTGTVRPNQHTAVSEELRILARRFTLVARFFSQFVNYLCPGTGRASFGGCSDECADADAFACRGVGAVFVCPPFWAFDLQQQGSVLVHEALHIILGPTNPRGVGQIGDETLSGSGRNFNVAGCYEALLPDLLGFGSVADCPAPP